MRNHPVVSVQMGIKSEKKNIFCMCVANNKRCFCGTRRERNGNGNLKEETVNIPGPIIILAVVVYVSLMQICDTFVRGGIFIESTGIYFMGIDRQAEKLPFLRSHAEESWMD